MWILKMEKVFLISKPKTTQTETTFNFGIAVVLGGQNGSLPISETFDLNNDGILDSFFTQRQKALVLMYGVLLRIRVKIFGMGTIPIAIEI